MPQVYMIPIPYAETFFDGSYNRLPSISNLKISRTTIVAFRLFIDISKTMAVGKVSFFRGNLSEKSEGLSLGHLCT